MKKKKIEIIRPILNRKQNFQRSLVSPYTPSICHQDVAKAYQKQNLVEVKHKTRIKWSLQYSFGCRSVRKNK